MQDSFSGNEQHPYEYEEQWEEEEESQQHQEEISENEDNQESPRANSTENKKSSNYTYQAQKIIINDLEDNNESPTYMDFFENGQKRIQTVPNDTNDTEEQENKKTQPRRWEILYERAKGAKQAKEELRKEYKAGQLDPECTFRPKLLSSNNNKLLYTTEPDEGRGPGLSIHERNKLWKSRVDSKLLETRETFKDHDMIGCTFKPNIAKSQTKEYATKGLTSYGSKGIDLYLRRRIIANQHREEKEKILENPLTKLPPHVYKKDGNITIPRGPGFIRKPHEINSLKKPLEFPKPTDRFWTNENESPERAMSPQKKSQILVNPIHVGNLKFGDAIQKLHHELHRMNIN